MDHLSGLKNAIVDEDNIKHYLLSTEHPTGRAKAQFFMAFGFSVDAWATLRDALLQHAENNEVGDEVVTQFGTKYQVDGPLATPDGRNPQVRAIWFVANDEKEPRFVTAYPV